MLIGKEMEEKDFISNNTSFISALFKTLDFSSSFINVFLV